VSALEKGPLIVEETALRNTEWFYRALDPILTKVLKRVFMGTHGGIPGISKGFG
jgi:hypothetical protein